MKNVMTMVKIPYSEYSAHHAVDFTKLMICQLVAAASFRISQNMARTNFTQHCCITAWRRIFKNIPWAQD